MISLHFVDQRFELTESNGMVYFHRVSETKDFRGQPIDHPKELILVLTKEESSYLASGIRMVLGEEKLLESKEKIVSEKAPTE